MGLIIFTTGFWILSSVPDSYRDCILYSVYCILYTVFCILFSIAIGTVFSSMVPGIQNSGDRSQNGIDYFHYWILDSVFCFR